MATSQNGYSANDRSVITNYNIAGEILPMREGATGELLAHLAEWIHENVESISAGHQQDDWGYAERPIRGSTTTLSNHASGTAFDFNATQHPLGVRGSWGLRKKRKINRQLRTQYENVIRWGENYKGRPDGMHFEINEDFDEVVRVLNKVRGNNTKTVRKLPAVDLGNVRAEFRKGGTKSLPGVKRIQRELNARGETLAVDGYAGPSTRTAYRRFEKSIPGANGDGIPGYFSLRVLGGLVPLPQRKKFRVVK